MGTEYLRQGFLKSIQLVLKLQEGGLATAGPPCGSFVFVNLGTSRRSRARPFGAPLEYVRKANRTLAWETSYHLLWVVSYYTKSWEHLDSNDRAKNQPYSVRDLPFAVQGPRKDQHFNVHLLSCRTPISRNTDMTVNSTDASIAI